MYYLDITFHTYLINGHEGLGRLFSKVTKDTETCNPQGHGRLSNLINMHEFCNITVSFIQCAIRLKQTSVPVGPL